METDLASAAELQRENEDLRDELAKTRADKEFVWSLWKKLQVAAPDVSQAVGLVVQREKEKAEAKDQKVLQILQAKDATLAELESQNSRLSAELSSLMKQKADLLDRVERLDSEVISLHDKNRFLMSQLNAAERAAGSAQHSQDARDSLARSEAESSRLRAQVGQLQAEAADLRDQTATARMAARAAQDEARAARAESAADRERRSQLEGQAAMLQQVQALQEGTQAMLEAQSDELTGLRAELQRWRDTCADLEARLASAAPGVAAAKSSSASALDPLPDYPYKVAQLEAKIAGLRARLRAGRPVPSVPQAMVELQSRLNAAGKRAAAAEAEGRVKDAEAGRLRAAVQKKAARVASLKAALRLAKADSEERLDAERLLENNARLENELGLAQVHLAEHSEVVQQLRKSLDFERRANAELRDAVNSAVAEAAAPRAEDVRVLTGELESARRKVLQLRDLIGRQSRELEAHAAARRDADGRADAARAELTRKNQVLVEMKRYLRHLGRRVTGLRVGATAAVAAATGAGAAAAATTKRRRPTTATSEEAEQDDWEDVPEADDEDEGDAAVDSGGDGSDDDDQRLPASGRSLGRTIAAASAPATATATSSPPLFVARLQARAGALQQQLLQCRRARQKALAERDQANAGAERLRRELAQCQARCRRLKEACDRAQQASKDPGYHSEGPTMVDEYADAAAAAASSDHDLLLSRRELATCRQARQRAERELRAARDTTEELRRRLRAAEEAANKEREAADKARAKAATLKETVRRTQSQVESSRSAATSAGEQRRRFEQLWQEARAELEQSRQRLRQSAADADRRRRQADDATAKSQAAVDAAREQLGQCHDRLSMAERLLGQLSRLVEAKADAVRLLVAAHCDREPPPQPPPPQPPTTTLHQQASQPPADPECQRRARERAAGILNLSQGELDSLLSCQQPQQQQMLPHQLHRRRLAELRAALGSREADKQWTNQCLRLAQAIRTSSASSDGDQLLDKFSEKLDEILNIIRLLAT